MAEMVSIIQLEGIKIFAIILCVIVLILGAVCIMLNFQIGKMLNDSEIDKKKHDSEIRKVREELEDCKLEKRELERQKEEAEQAAQNYKEQRDFLMDSKKSEEDSK